MAAGERDPRVAEVCRSAGARLDGTDDLLVLCAIDDALAGLLPEAEHPLYRPVSFRPRVGRHRPGRATPAEALLEFFGPAGRRPRVSGAAPALRIDVDRMLEEFRDPLDELRWPGGGRPGIERIARGIPSWDVRAREHLEDCLAAVRVGPEGRQAMVRRARRLESLPRELALAQTLLAALSRFAEAHGCRPLAHELPAPGSLDHAVFRAIDHPLTPEDEVRRRWLAAQAARVGEEPHRLRVRSQEASEIAGVAPPWTEHGPASLAEALEAWRRRFGSPRDLDRLEAETRRTRVLLAGALVEAFDESRKALEAPAVPCRQPRAARNGDDAGRTLAAALAALAGELRDAGARDERQALERLVSVGGLTAEAVRAAVRRLSSAVA